jgi:hypothetical protein
MGTFEYASITKALCLLLALSILPATSVAEESLTPTPDQTHVYWGDLHVHTMLSGDAYILGARLTPDDAYRFAQGETVRASGGQDVRLRRPLDFLMIADHAMNMGIISHLVVGDESLAPNDETRRQLRSLPPLPEILNAETREEFDRGSNLVKQLKGDWQASHNVTDELRRSIWKDAISFAEKYNAPGRFTTFVGFEWSGRSPFMVHRNVLFADGPDVTTQVLPFSRLDSDNVEDLWAYLSDYEDRFNGNAIALPHNGNLSRGAMFALSTVDGDPLSTAYAKERARWEPIYEVTQIKGDGEAHPILSPDDEFADYETWPPGSLTLITKTTEAEASAAPGTRERSSYARSALKLGLDQEVKLAVNPFKFGLIGSTDSHTALATADEDRFWGKMGLNEPSPYRSTDEWYYSASGYAAIWATENTREALFAAMKRKETYATTGPRMTVRFFGGWDYETDDATRADLAQVGYAKGVPMGGDLAHAPDGTSPRFLIRAAMDPDGAHLDRAQIVKGWRDSAGELHEKIYNVALSDGREEDEDGTVVPVGNTVDVPKASYTNTIGAEALAVVWQDPDFDKDEPAFYYVRVLEIPTPRWTAYDAKLFGLRDLPDHVPMTTQDRAYTSPIWYTP